MLKPLREDTPKKNILFSGRTTKVLPSLHGTFFLVFKFETDFDIFSFSSQLLG